MTEVRENYPHMLSMPVRLADVGSHAQVNNVVYYAYFDTVVNDYLIGEGGLDMGSGQSIGVVAETKCHFHGALHFRENVDACLRVARLGTSSVRYEIGLFPGHDSQPVATGHFVHVFVDRGTRRPVPIPDGIRTALQRLTVG